MIHPTSNEADGVKFASLRLKPTSIESLIVNVLRGGKVVVRVLTSTPASSFTAAATSKSVVAAGKVLVKGAFPSAGLNCIRRRASVCVTDGLDALATGAALASSI